MLRLDEDLSPGGEQSRWLSHHWSFVRVHRLRQRHDDAGRADLSGSDSGQVAGDAHRARAPGRPAEDDSCEGWEYTSPAGTAIRLLPAGTPFLQSHVYEFTYTAKNPVVAAVGLAATRDFVSFLRHGQPTEGNPLAGDVQFTFSYSISQPSRALNDFQALGFNEDENGKRVIDGILSHTGGGSGDQINYRFAQTGRTERNRQNHLYPEGVFPFAHQVLTDHLSRKTDGRSARCTASNTCPKRFEVNTANEYWVKAGSLLHTDTRGRDLKDPRNVRFYLMSGLSHGVGDITDRGVCQQFTNGVSPYAAHRALLIALDEWVSHGIQPPKSEVPRLADNTAAFAVPRPGSQTGVVPQDVLGWPTIPGVTYNGLITTRYFLDFGPMFETASCLIIRPQSRTSRLSDFCVEGGRRRQRIGRRPLAAGGSTGCHDYRLGIAPRRL